MSEDRRTAQAAERMEELKGCICPHLPAVPEMGLTKPEGSKLVLSPDMKPQFTGRLLHSPCVGTQCALWDSCQGLYSSPEHRKWVGKLVKSALTMLDAVAVFKPGLRPVIDGLKSVLSPD